MKRASVTICVMKFVESNECHWFLDVINSYQTKKHIDAVPFQVWIFTKNETGNGCVVTCEDGDKNVVITQKIEFTDLNLDTFRFWLLNDTVLLPSEY